MMRSAATEMYPGASCRSRGRFCLAPAGAILSTLIDLPENISLPCAGVADLDDSAIKDRIDGRGATRDQAKADADRAQAMLQNSGSRAVTPQMLGKFVRAARQRIRLEGGGYRRGHLRAVAQHVEVAEGEVRIMRSKSPLLQTLVANGGANAAPTQGLKWRTGWDSNPRWG